MKEIIDQIVENNKKMSEISARNKKSWTSLKDKNDFLLLMQDNQTLQFILDMTKENEEYECAKKNRK